MISGCAVLAEAEQHMEEQVSLAELPAALDNTLMVPRSGLQCAALMSYRYKLQCLKIQVRQVARERDKARLDLEKAERRCLQLGRELDEQYVALEHTQSKLRDFQAEIEAKDLLLQQAVSHQAKLEAGTQFLHGKEASWQGRLSHTMKVSKTALGETSSLLQRRQSRGGDKDGWFVMLGRTEVLCRRIISHIHTIELNIELFPLL